MLQTKVIGQSNEDTKQFKDFFNRAKSPGTMQYYMQQADSPVPVDQGQQANKMAVRAATAYMTGGASEAPVINKGVEYLTELLFVNKGTPSVPPIQGFEIGANPVLPPVEGGIAYAAPQFRGEAAPMGMREPQIREGLKENDPLLTMGQSPNVGMKSDDPITGQTEIQSTNDPIGIKSIRDRYAAMAMRKQKMDEVEGRDQSGMEGMGAGSPQTFMPSSTLEGHSNNPYHAPGMIDTSNNFLAPSDFNSSQFKLSPGTTEEVPFTNEDGTTSSPLSFEFNKGTHKVAGIDPQKYAIGDNNVQPIGQKYYGQTIAPNLQPVKIPSPWDKFRGFWMNNWNRKPSEKGLSEAPTEKYNKNLAAKKSHNADMMLKSEKITGEKLKNYILAQENGLA